MDTALVFPEPLQTTATQIHSMTSTLSNSLPLCKLVGTLTLHVGRALHKCKSVSMAQTITTVPLPSLFIIKVATSRIQSKAIPSFSQSMDHTCYIG